MSINRRTFNTLVSKKIPNVRNRYSIIEHRHCYAVHLLESGVELIQIRDFLGHSSVITTEIYAKTTSRLKQEALEKNYQQIPETDSNHWEDDDDLLEWLINFTK